MISDKNITSIEYNHLNLPTYIYIDNKGVIEYLYNAAGQKVQKRVYDYNAGTDGMITDVKYLDGYQYDYVYNYTDHLDERKQSIALVEVCERSSVRVSYTQDPVNKELKILEENHYYPFGLKHSLYTAGGKKDYQFDESDPEEIARPGFVTSIPYQYKYNGKEFQDELNLSFYDFGARNYDPALGRWMNIDPLAEKNPGWTPYRYAFNNPNIFTDPTGMLEDWYQSGKGDYVYDASITSEQDFIDAGLDGKYLGESYSFGVTSSGEQIGTVNLNTDGSADFVTTGGEISSFTDATVDMGFDSGHLIKAGNWQEGNNMNWNDVVQKLNGFGFANGTKTRLIDIAGRNGGLTKTTQNYLKFFKGIGIAGAITSSTLTGVSAYEYYKNGGTDSSVAIKAGLDITMSFVGTFGGPIGFGISSIYFILDTSTGGFGGYGAH